MNKIMVQLKSMGDGCISNSCKTRRSGPDFRENHACAKAAKEKGAK